MFSPCNLSLSSFLQVVLHILVYYKVAPIWFLRLNIILFEPFIFYILLCLTAFMAKMHPFNVCVWRKRCVLSTDNSQLSITFLGVFILWALIVLIIFRIIKCNSSWSKWNISRTLELLEDFEILSSLAIICV